MSRRSSLLTTFLAAAALTLAAGPSFASLHAGDVAPDFRGTDLDGVSRKLSDLRGQVVILFVLGSS